MIKSKKEYLEYIKADRAASYRTGRSGFYQLIRRFIYKDYIWNYQTLLRKVEYFRNCKKGYFSKLYYYFLRRKLHVLQYKLGIFIPPNTIGSGLYLPHSGSIVIHKLCKIGANFIVNVDTVIGSDGDQKCPRIGNNVIVEAGAKIYGDIQIGDDVVIGTNSVVNKSFTEKDITIAGAPAKKIKDKGRSLRKDLESFYSGNNGT